MAFFLLFIFACKKDLAITPLSSPQPNLTELSDLRSEGFGLSKCDSIKNAVYKSINEGGVLVFSDEQHFYDCSACLQKAYDDFNDSYTDQYPQATAEQLDSLDLVNSFNQWKPYEDFESSLNFSSLRAKIENEILLYEQIPYSQQDPDENPDWSVPIIDEATRTLFSETGYVKINDTLRSITEWDPAGLTVWDNCAFLADTKRTIDEDDDYGLAGNRQIVLSIYIRSGLITSNLKSKVVFKKNGSRKRAYMRLGQEGTAFDGECNPTSGSWAKYKGWKKSKQITVTRSQTLLWREAVVDPSDPWWELLASFAVLSWERPNGQGIAGFFLRLRRN